MLGRWKQRERAYIDVGAERQPPGLVGASFQQIMAAATSRLHSLSAGLAAFALLVAPNADKADCGHLADRHTAAAAKVIEALRDYEKCVSSGDKHDDCAAAIEALDTAHDDFADAVDDAKTCK